jgi:hypothetical protein
MTKTERYYEKAAQGYAKITKINNKQAKHDGFTPDQNDQMFQTASAQQFMLQSLSSAQKSNGGSIVRQYGK